MQRMKIDVEQKEQLEKGAKSCWNKFSHFTDKFTEVIFIVSLSLVSLYSFISMFIKGGKFSIFTLLQSIYQIILAPMVYKSWKAEVTFLMYFGFLRGRFSKTLFLLFCACMTFPSQANSQRETGFLFFLHYTLSYTLCFASAAQILKYFNKDEEKEAIVRE